MEINKKTIKEIHLLYETKKDAIKDQLNRFSEFYKTATDIEILEELMFCILTSGVGPRIGEKSLISIKNLIIDGKEEEIFEVLKKVHKYPDKSKYIVITRDYFKQAYNLKIKELILSFSEPIERRDFFASNTNIKGMGYTQASHFLRNIGFRGYAILDKNIVKFLYEIGISGSIKPPASRKKYLELENKFKEFSIDIGIEIDELDLLLWSRNTGRIPR